MGRYLKELKIRYVKTKKRNPFYGNNIDSPDEIYKMFKNVRLNDKEQIISVHFNNRLEINCFEVVSIGDSGSCLFSPKEIFKGIFLSNSSAFILIHNHTTGDSRPSDQDLKVLQIIEKGSELVGVQLLDFMVIGDYDYWSLKKNCKEKYEK